MNNYKLEHFDFDEVISLRRDLHKMPETAFSEIQTSKYIINYLNELGINLEHSIAETGIIAELKGLKESKRAPKTVLLRADMDGLPIKEETGLAFSSTNGNMHACGHDGHMAILLSVAKILSQNLDIFSGTVKFIFQPAEEEIGGAKAMIKEKPNVFNSASFMFGFHIWNQIETGKIAVNNGTVFVGADTFKIKINGRGGHGAMPHESIDPIYIASNIIVSAQSIISRNLSPNLLGVISFGKINAGSAANIIPDCSELQGTIRSQNPEEREFLINRLRELVDGISESFNGSSEFEITSGTSPVVNNKNFALKVAEITAQVAGEDSVINVPPVSVADDVSEFMALAPSVYALLGALKDGAEMHHNSKFDFDEGCLRNGIEIMLNVALDKLD